MKKEQNKIIGLFIVGIIVMLAIIAFQIFKSGQLTHDPMENMDETMEMVMDDESMSDNKTDKDDTMMTEEVMDKEDSMMNEGVMAPDFSLMDLEGNTVSLAELKGEKVYIKFWASWCSICLSGLDEIDELSAEMNDFKVLTIVAPNYNGEQAEDAFKEWFKTRDADKMTVLLDHDGMVTKAFNVRGYPTSVFIGSDGVLVQAFPGHVSSEQIKNFFEEIK